VGLRIVWKDFDPRVQRIHFVYGTIGPRLDRYKRRDELLHYYVLFPYTTWIILSEGFEIFYSIMEKIARGREEELTEKEKRVIDEMEVIHIPEDVYDTMEEIRKAAAEKWRKIEPAFNEVIYKVLGKEPSQEIFVYPAFTFKNWDGTAYRNVVVLATEPRKRDMDLSIIAHEMLHPILGKDKTFSKTLTRVSMKMRVPAEEAFVQTITNLVLWRAGLAAEMFEQYYDPDWEALKVLEDKMREIVKTWWENGRDTNLKRTIIRAFCQ